MTRPSRAVPHLFRHWNDVAARVRAHQRVVVFLDFDGTLAHIASRPDRVQVKPGMRRVLLRLAKHPKATLVVISGRRQNELRRCVGIPRLRYLGLYGWDRGGNRALPPSERVALSKAHALLSTELTKFPRIWIEPKRNSFSVHLLGVGPRLKYHARQLVRKSLQPFRATLQLLENLRDIEVMPRRIPDKGAAVRKLLAKPASHHALAFFFGDDLSDEPAFAAVRGVAVLVGKPRKTRAKFRLRGPDEVAAALTRLEETLG
jgi:trehalose 6-phosphate phosphatase